jgi:hypothetical protein
VSAGFFHRPGGLQELLAALHGTWAGHYDQLFITYSNTVNRDDGVMGVELPAGKLEGPQNRHCAFNAIHPLDLLTVNGPIVADHTDDGTFLPLREVDTTPHLLNTSGDVSDLGHSRVWFHHHNHLPSFYQEIITSSTTGVVAAG